MLILLRPNSKLKCLIWLYSFYQSTAGCTQAEPKPKEKFRRFKRYFSPKRVKNLNNFSLTFHAVTTNYESNFFGLLQQALGAPVTQFAQQFVKWLFINGLKLRACWPENASTRRTVRLIVCETVRKNDLTWEGNLLQIMALWRFSLKSAELVADRMTAGHSVFFRSFPSFCWKSSASNGEQPLKNDQKWLCCCTVLFSYTLGIHFKSPN